MELQGFKIVISHPQQEWVVQIEGEYPPSMEDAIGKEAMEALVKKAMGQIDNPRWDECLSFNVTFPYSPDPGKGYACEVKESTPKDQAPGHQQNDDRAMLIQDVLNTDKRVVDYLSAAFIKKTLK
jgi:hypothetical protein